MHITFPKANLQKAINVLQKVSQNKTSSNLPGAIYITTKNGQVELQGNDFELGIRLTIDGDIKEPGTLVVGSRYFQELIRKLPGDTIELYKPEDGNSLTITSGSSEFNLVTLHPDDFSLVEQIHDQDHVNIDSFAMKELIDLTNYAAATDEDRPVFTGALLEIKENEVTMVATDTHRMAVKKITIDEPATTPMRAIIPTKTLAEVSRLLPTDNPAMINIIWNRTQIVFNFESIYIISRLIEGTYPEYEKVIPSQFDSSAVIDRREFAGAVDRVSLLAKDISYNVIRYDWAESNVTLSTQNTEIGMAKEDVAVEFKGTPFTISFNGRYISDILRHSTGDNIHLFLKQNGPVVIRQDNNPNYTYVVTPVRTNA
ncbi:DNA polymerase III, beta subunit [Veillonella dispar ATCC 17748]|jgi:DNA polymerase-3 subunit beta|uniref:Beta sliding clamp n=2 Tax=Veillonella TaxID=29465 RepID=C4FMI8_9FIRM|nr:MULTISPECIES: DNA polymerase III subunit beta [Veillonella]EEP65983.1 DNA polymerase III, beta subunit [Veillonella dispar ATCC 17748]MBS5765710.1 DNA polymerase III subunit beta [Veillonella sp.]MBS7143422.1 DNA polymerase III subunit beta [Veillonella sp.]MCB8605959.1 DNA polymerase III subunit beta [Veillonella nakazawae]MDU5865803.1 DNA polymerase III subunit beta [Veillonella sp.]